MKDAQDKLTKVLLLASSLAVLLVLAYAAYMENFGADWYRHQSEYKRQLVAAASSERQREAAERFEVGPKQLYLPALNRIDRCVTCHVSIDNPAMEQVPQPLTAHTGQIMQNHPKETFGCTICHEGQGRAAIAADAHGHVPHWPRPMLANDDLEQSCPKCHTDRFLPEVHTYNAAMDLFYEHGCLSCHKLRGRGGDIGPDITKAGEIHDAEWHFKHFKDPKSVVETSEMPNENLTDEQARHLAFLMMCYKGELIPTDLLSNPTQEVAQMKLPEPLDPLALEGFVGSQYCISCHGATHPGSVKTWRDSPMATTYERIRHEAVKDNCVPCHSTGLNSETGHYAEEGVGCEACHGPGREAVRLVLAGKTTEHKEAIRIDRNSEPACERCHNPHVPTAVHAEFYRKMPTQKPEDRRLTSGVRPPSSDIRSVDAAPDDARPTSELEPLTSERQAAALELAVGAESPSGVQQELIPAPEPLPVVEKTSDEPNLPAMLEVVEDEVPLQAPQEPATPSLGGSLKGQALEDGSRGEAVPALRPAGIPSATLRTGMSAVEDKGKMPSPRGTPSAQRGQDALATWDARDTSHPRMAVEAATLPTIRAPEVLALPQIDIFSGVPAARPPEKIEGGCVSTECHSATVLGQVVHGPTAQQDCVSCHRLLDEPNHKFEMPTKEPDLCFECHDPPPAHEFQHGPVALGVCTVCHNPHSGPESFMLPATGNDLCFKCHIEMREHVHTVQIQHDVIAEEGCTACHDPHSSDFNRQIKGDMPALCLECHEQVAEILEKAVVVHEPVTTDGKCANCHAPHGGDVPELLLDQEVSLCLDCHDEPMETPNGTIIDMKTWLQNNPERHGPIREGNCTLCHQPHGSQHFRLLAYEFPRKFYSPFSVEVYDLCFQCHEDTLVLDEQTTALTDFRNGNENLHYVHVNQKRGRTCRACHEVHAGTQPKRMKDFVPYGTWMYPINFELAAEGGKCAPGCHLPRAYNRKQAVIQR